MFLLFDLIGGFIELVVAELVLFLYFGLVALILLAIDWLGYCCLFCLYFW